MPVLPATHPANPEADFGMVLEPSDLLSRHHPPPDTEPKDDPAQHDHVQQRGHGMPEHGSTPDMQDGMPEHGPTPEMQDGMPKHDSMPGMEGGMKGMDGGGMDHGPHDKNDKAHDHGADKQGPATGPMSGMARSGRIYRCPIHTGETSPYVGNCPKCGKPREEGMLSKGDSMQHVPMDEGTEQSKASYFCTMHPQLPLDSPGLCPVCGMTLIERKEGGK